MIHVKRSLQIIYIIQPFSAVWCINWLLQGNNRLFVCSSSHGAGAIPTDPALGFFGSPVLI